MEILSCTNEQCEFWEPNLASHCWKGSNEMENCPSNELNIEHYTFDYYNQLKEEEEEC